MDARVLTGPAPLVVLTAPVGVRVTAVSGTLAWTVLEEAPAFPFVDWQAPLGATVTYTAAGETATVTVASTVADAVSSLRGDLVARVDRENARARSFERDLEVLWPKDRPEPFTLGPPALRAPTEPFTCLTDAGGSDAIEAMLEHGEEVVIRHNIARCRIARCRIPAARLFTIEKATSSYQGKDRHSEWTEWTLTGYTAAAPTNPVPARTWADVAAQYATWAGVGALASWSDLLEA